MNHSLTLTIVLKIAVMGLCFGLMNLSYDYLRTKNSGYFKNEKLDSWSIVLISILFGSVSIILPLSSNKMSSNIIWAVAGIFFVLLVGLLISAGIYTLGIKNGKKYWRNHVEKFYAYGIGIFIIVGLSIFLIVGNSIGGSDYEDIPKENEIDISQILTGIIALFIFLLPSYWLGVFIQNQRQHLEQIQNQDRHI